MTEFVSEGRKTIPGSMSEIPAACGWVVEIAERVGLPPRDIGHCELAVDEACTNIIEHGYDNNGAGKVIDIVCLRSEHEFKIKIIDEGPPFDPLAHDEPDPLSVLDDRPEEGGGWGLYFIKRVMDHVSYEYTDQRNHLIMVKRL